MSSCGWGLKVEAELCTLLTVHSFLLISVANSKHFVIEREMENTPHIRQPNSSNAIQVFNHPAMGRLEPKIHLSRSMNKTLNITNTQAMPEVNSTPVDSVISLMRRASVLDRIRLPIPPITPNQPVITAITARMKSPRGPRISRAKRTFRHPEPLFLLHDAPCSVCVLWS